MAAGASRDIRKELSNVMECSVCCETYDDPRHLPCIHSYCLKCIESFCRDKLPGDAVACPLCMEKFDIPEHGVASLPKNFFVEQLRDIAGTASRPSHCDVCSSYETDAAMKKTATVFCVDCSERFCEVCASVHRRQRATKGHHLVDDKNDESSETRVRLARIYCDKHYEKDLERYCFDCKTAICLVCFITESHQMHKCADISQVANEFRRELIHFIKSKGDTVTRCRDIIEGEKRKNEKFNNDVRATEKEICDHVHKLIRLIDQEKSNLLKELDSFKVERNKLVNNVVEDLEQHVSFIESLISYAEQLKNKGTSGDIAQQMSSIQDRAEELMSLDALQRAASDLGLINVTFTAATWSTSLASGDFVGQINLTRLDDASPYPKKLNVKGYCSGGLSLPCITVGEVGKVMGDIQAHRSPADVDVDLPEAYVGGDGEIKRPEGGVCFDVDGFCGETDKGIDLKGKGKVKGPKIGGGVDLPKGKLGADVKIDAPKVDIETPELKGKGKVKGPKIGGGVDIDLPDANVDVDIDLAVKKPKVKGGSGFGGFKMPKFHLGGGGKGKADIDVNLPSADVDVDLPEAHVGGGLDVKGPKGGIGGGVGVDVKAPHVEVDVWKPKDDGKFDFPSVRLSKKRSAKANLDIDAVENYKTRKDKAKGRAGFGVLGNRPLPTLTNPDPIPHTDLTRPNRTRR